jgi:hypothetical protein
MDWGTGIPIAVSLIALGVSIYSVSLSRRAFLADRKDKTPSLETTTSVGFPVLIGKPATPHVLMTVANAGLLDVHVNAVGLVLPDHGGQRIVFLDLQGSARLPVDLKQGQNAVFWVETKSLAKTLRDGGMAGIVEIETYATDAVGREYRSKP